jgi:hypothetical protein
MQKKKKKKKKKAVTNSTCNTAVTGTPAIRTEVSAGFPQPLQ